MNILIMYLTTFKLYQTRANKVSEREKSCFIAKQFPFYRGFYARVHTVPFITSLLMSTLGRQKCDHDCFSTCAMNRKNKKNENN